MRASAQAPVWDSASSFIFVFYYEMSPRLGASASLLLSFLCMAWPLMSSSYLLVIY